MVMKEFGYCGPNSQKFCLAMLANVDVDPDDEWWYWIALILLFLFFRVLALFILKEKASVFH